MANVILRVVAVVRVVGWSVSWSASRFTVGRSFRRLVGWSVCWSVGLSVSWLVGRSVGRPVGWSVDQSVGGWLVVWSVGWLVVRRVASHLFPGILACISKLPALAGWYIRFGIFVL